MMNIRAHSRFYYYYARKALGFFWAICLGIAVINILLGVRFNFQGSNMGVNHTINGVSSSSIVMGFLIPMAIYAVVTGINTLPETLPHLLSMGTTRRNAYTGILCYYGALSLVMTVIMMGMLVLEKQLYPLLGWNHLEVGAMMGGMGVTGVLPFGAFLFTVLITLLALLNFASAMFNYFNSAWMKFGMIPVIIFLLINSKTRGLLFTLFQWIVGDGWVFSISLKLLGIALGLSVMAWPLIRRSEFRK